MKEIAYGSEARTRIKAGIDKAANAVAPTLGAVGMAALIDWEGLDPIVSDDGITILKNLEFEDKYANMGLKMVRKSATRTSIEGGDGTATTTVLTRALVERAFEELEKEGSDVQSVVRRLKDGLAQILDRLKEIKRDVKPEDIESIARISSLDPEMAGLIAEAIKDVGINGIITVEKSGNFGYSKEIVKGMRIETGLISPYFINDLERERCVLESPAIIIVDRKVAMNEQITSVMNSIAKTGNHSVLWVADSVESLALASLILNNQQGTFKVACIKNPYTASRAREFLEDLAVLTGGTVISEEAGMKLDTATDDLCGHAEKVIVTKDTCTIIGGNASDKLQARIKSIETQMAETTSEYERVMLKERLAALTGGIGVIRVGTYTDIDYHAKKLKFENAINATQAALAEGILPGGGIALIKAGTKVTEPIFSWLSFVPFKQMCKNAGIDTSLSFEQIKQDIGFNFKNGEEVNMFDAGIIDPFKVTRLALESAVAITLNLITTETAIVNEPQKKENQV